jgi:NADP-dependent 3-hydroxy acid dehydrogenase YdfG
MIARALADDGYGVCLLARDGSAAAAVAGEIGSVGGLAMARSVDVTDEVAVGETVRAVLSSWGRIDLLVNSAGSIEREVPLWEAEVDQWCGQATSGAGEGVAD